MNEEQIIWSLISSLIENFKSSMFDTVKRFYAKYDPRKSLDRSFIIDLISRVNAELRCISLEVEHGEEDNC